MEQKLYAYMSMIEGKLLEMRDMYNVDIAPYQQVCPEAMWYSLEAGGKRIRPILVLEMCNIFGGDVSKALDSACAIEMVHTFSLIHDDLPCMDDDDLRRGKPSCHKQFSEATALLAGDALECLAFETIANDESLDYQQRVMLIKELSHAIGVCGMIGGQTIDTLGADNLNDSQLLSMYSMKTSALIKAACVMGCICAKAYEYIPAVKEYAESIGLAFQIIDDILDVTADEKELGKPIGSDAQMGKKTFVAVHGLDKAKEKANALTQKAIDIANSLPNNEFILYLTNMLLNRKK